MKLYPYSILHARLYQGVAIKKIQFVGTDSFVADKSGNMQVFESFYTELDDMFGKYLEQFEDHIGYDFEYKERRHESGLYLSLGYDLLLFEIPNNKGPETFLSEEEYRRYQLLFSLFNEIKGHLEKFAQTYSSYNIDLYFDYSTQIGNGSYLFASASLYIKKGHYICPLCESDQNMVFAIPLNKRIFVGDHAVYQCNKYDHDVYFMNSPVENFIYEE